MTGQAPSYVDPIFGPQAQGPQDDLIGSIIEDAAMQRAQEAQGLEHITYGVGAGLKAFGDAVTNMGFAALKGMAALESGVQGKGFAEGWDSVSRMSEEGYGTTDPSILDVWHGAGLTDLTGKQADETINKRLGSEAIAWQTVGNLASYMVGPGAAVGQTAGKVAAPLAGFAERAIGRAVAKGTPGAAEALKTGKVWEFLAKSDEWQKSAGILARMGAGVGKRTADTVQVAASNVAQSALMTPDEQRVDASIMAGALAPFVLPIARAGEKLGGKVMQFGMDDAQKRNLLGGYRALERGDINLEQLDDIVRSNVPLRYQVAGQTVTAPVIEGSAFMFLDPHAREEMQKALGGDRDAAARVLAMWFGTAAGVAASKHMVPHNMLPFFKAVRPEANSLQTWIDAETNKQLAREKFKQEQQEPEPSKDLPEGWEKLSPEELEDVKQKLHAAHADWSAAQNKRRPIEQQVAARAQEIAQEKQANYGWAEGPALGMLRSGWEPELNADGSVALRFGRDDLVTLKRDDAGTPKMTVSPRLESVLQDFGLTLPEGERSVLAPALIEYRGASAKKLLDDITLVAMARRLNGDMTYQRLGMQEVMPGVWKDAEGKLHQMQLDGSTATKESVAATKWTGKEDLAATGALEGPQWTNETVEQLKGWLLRKFADNPDPAVDSILGQVISLAHNGQSFGSEQIRQFFHAMPFKELADMTATPEGYRMLALELGSLASGHHNAQDMAAELVAQAQQKAPPTVPADDRADFLSRQEGVPPENPEGMRANEQESFRQAMEEGAQAEALSLGEKLLKSQRPPEPGVTEAGSGIGPSPEMRQALRRGGRRVWDEVFARQADVITKGVPGDDLGYTVRRSMSEGENRLGKLRDKWSPGEKAAKSRLLASKEEKAQATRLKTEVIESPVDPEAGFFRWRQVYDQNIQPDNPVEKTFSEAGQEAGLAAFGMIRKAGGVRTVPQEKGPPKTVPLGHPKKSILPYQLGPDADKVMHNAELRRGWFETIVKHHPDVEVPNVVEGRPMGKKKLDVEWLEREWREEQSQIKDPKYAARESAAEHLRFLHNVPDVWRKYKMLEPNPFKAIDSALAQQARRAAALEEFGPEIPADQRAAILKEAELTGTTNPVVEKLRAGKFGVQDRLRRFEQAALSLRDTNRSAGFVRAARDLLVRAQGGRPEQLWINSPAVRDYLGVSSAAMAAKGFVWDLAEPIFRTGSYAGYRKSVSKLIHLMRPRNFKEVAQYIDQMGAAERQVSDWIIGEASGKLDKVRDIIGWLGSKTERFKSIHSASMADDIVKRIQSGEGTLNDQQIAQDILRMSPQDMAAIEAGHLSEPLANQLRRELTRLFTSRGRPGEGSRFAANSNVSNLVRFHKFATARLEQTVAAVGSVLAARQRHGTFSRESMVAMKRLMRVVGGMTATGIIGQAMAYALTSWISEGDPMKGVMRVWRELSTAKLWTLGKAFGMQAVGGPFGQLVNAVINNKDAESAWGLTVPGQLGYTLVEAAHSLKKGDGNQAISEMLYGSGVVPMRGDVWSLMRAMQAASVAEGQALSDSKIVSQFKRFEGIDDTIPGERKRPDAFYDSISKVISIARSMPEAPPKEVLNAVMADLRTSLDLAPEESVAAAVRARKLTGFDDDTREKFHDYVGDTATIERIYQHDKALMELASGIDKLEGVEPKPFQTQLDQVREQARFGGGDRWRALSERVVDEAHQRVLAGDSISATDIEELAQAMAEHSDQVAELFNKGTERFLLSDTVDSTAKARRIAAELRNRTRARVAAKKREEARERAEDARAR